MATPIPADALPVLTFITDGAVAHDGVFYPHGSEFKTSDPKLIERLRARGAIKLREEVEALQDVAVRIANLEAERDALLARLAELEAMVGHAPAEAPVAEAPAPVEAPAAAPAPAPAPAPRPAFVHKSTAKPPIRAAGK